LRSIKEAKQKTEKGKTQREGKFSCKGTRDIPSPHGIFFVEEKGKGEYGRKRRDRLFEPYEPEKTVNTDGKKKCS
jgi:hypothetical protein